MVPNKMKRLINILNKAQLNHSHWPKENERNNLLLVPAK